jgi:membrane associated rhomboid family serine protease
VTPRVAFRATHSRARADEWALVLSSQALSPHVSAGAGGFVVWLPETQVESAERALSAWERENPPARDAGLAPAPAPGRSRAGVPIAAGLVLFFLVTGARRPGSTWFEAGSADAARILAGEVWRTATALTLHADLAHALGNAAMGAFLISAVCGAFGAGVGAAAVLACGIGGNAINALAHTASHSSVGASTAVFGALGLLCAPAFARRRRRRGARGRLLAPVAAGLGVIAMAGVGGERTDLWAHLFGFAVGALLGFPLVAAGARLRSRALQIGAGALALLALLGSWVLAAEGFARGST